MSCLVFLHTTYTCALKQGYLMSHYWLHTPDCKLQLRCLSDSRLKLIGSLTRQYHKADSEFGDESCWQMSASKKELWSFCWRLWHSAQSVFVSAHITALTAVSPASHAQCTDKGNAVQCSKGLIMQSSNCSVCCRDCYHSCTPVHNCSVCLVLAREFW